jgi:hypothetical protein
VRDYPIRKLALYQKESGWMVFLGVEPRSFGVALAELLRELGGGISLRLKPFVMAVPLFNYALAFALQLRKSTENLSQGSQAATGLLVAPTWLACWTSVHLGYPGDLSQPSVGTGAFRVSVLRVSPHQLTLSRNSRSML